MKNILAALLTAIALATAAPAGAVVKTGWRVTNASAALKTSAYGLTVKKIDYRKDLTRVYCTISGQPNTSSRITAITFGGKKATDIDGVDFDRYFQFEDSGSIDLEIDFPPMKPLGRATLVFVTKSGTFTYTIRR